MSRIKYIRELLEEELDDNPTHQEMMHYMALDMFHELMIRKDNETDGNADPEEVADFIVAQYAGVYKEELLDDYYDEIEEYADEDEEEDDEEEEDWELEEGFLSTAGFNILEPFQDLTMNYKKAAEVFGKLLDKEKKANDGQLKHTLEFYAQKFDHQVRGKLDPKRLVKEFEKQMRK
jgi:hypothetical protein